jgi:hypothetical protein
MMVRIRKNAWGNWCGYVGGRRVITFSGTPDLTAEQNAHLWLAEKQSAPDPFVQKPQKSLRVTPRYASLEYRRHIRDGAVDKGNRAIQRGPSAGERRHAERAIVMANKIARRSDNARHTRSKEQYGQH